MGDNSDQMHLQARLADAERRVAKLQVFVFGGIHQDYDRLDLQSLYWKACHRYIDLSRHEAYLWCRILKNMSTAQLLTLARDVQDPFPWKPFLVLLDYASMDGYPVDDATEHLLEIAQDLLNLQGLDLLTPNDLMGTPLSIQKAVASLL
jgi:hypothetical protein